jgi:hypothetical protein
MITLEMWREFADAVDDDITTSIARYENRRGKGARGIAEEMRDCLKIAHYLNHYPPHASTGISSERSTTSCSE